MLTRAKVREYLRPLIWSTLVGLVVSSLAWVFMFKHPGINSYEYLITIKAQRTDDDYDCFPMVVPREVIRVLNDDYGIWSHLVFKRFPAISARIPFDQERAIKLYVYAQNKTSADEYLQSVIAATKTIFINSAFTIPGLLSDGSFELTYLRSQSPIQMVDINLTFIITWLASSFGLFVLVLIRRQNVAKS